MSLQVSLGASLSPTIKSIKVRLINKGGEAKAAVGSELPYTFNDSKVFFLRGNINGQCTQVTQLKNIYFYSFSHLQYIQELFIKVS